MDLPSDVHFGGDCCICLLVCLCTVRLGTHLHLCFRSTQASQSLVLVQESNCVPLTQTLQSATAWQVWHLGLGHSRLSPLSRNTLSTPFWMRTCCRVTGSSCMLYISWTWVVPSSERNHPFRRNGCCPPSRLFILLALRASSAYAEWLAKRKRRLYPG